MTLPIVFADLESRSRADLKKAGGRNYWAHPSTELLCAVFCVDGEYLEWTRPEWPFGDCGPYALVAHNGVGFDVHGFRRTGWPEPARLIDTSELARRAGMPAADLDWLGENLCGRPKDKEGSALTKSLSRVSKKTGAFATPLTPAILARVVAYCRSDVEIMVRIWEDELHPWDDLPEENAVAEACRAINDRGIGFDSRLAHAIRALDAQLSAAARAKAGVEDPSDLRAPARFIAALAQLGVSIPNAQKTTVEPLLEHENPAVVALVAARLSGSTIAAGKLLAGLACVSADGRISDMQRYFGAHTGRWSGQRMQLQNLPKA